MFNKRKLLPLSTLNISIDDFSNIYLNELKLDIEVIDGFKHVFLNWYNGERFYNLATLIAIIKFNVELDPYLFDNIEPVFIDGDKNNCFQSNITYCFKNHPLVSKTKPGFYHIPFFTKYLINYAGDVFSTYSDRNLSFHVVKKQINDIKNRKMGYLKTKIKCDINNFSIVYGRHRLMALAFHKYQTNPHCMLVNHRDGIPGNDSVKNIEWSTHKANTQHAYDTGLYINKTLRVSVKNLLTNEVLDFISLAAACRDLGLDHSYALSALNDKKLCGVRGSYQFKLQNEKWPLIDFSNRMEKNPKREIIARNIFTGQYIIFNSITDVSERMKICIQAVQNNIWYNKVIPIKGHNYRYLHNEIIWPNHSEKHLQIYADIEVASGAGVLVTDMKGKEIYFHTSVTNAAIFHKVSVAQMRRFCKHTVATPGRLFSFYYLTDNLGPPIKQLIGA